jgi:hypothetical protein
MKDFASRFIGSPDTKEALEWLRGATPELFRSLGEHTSTGESIEWVENLYAAGAAKVLAVDIVRYDDGENTGRLLIELSDDTAERTTVLSIVGEIAVSQGFDAEVDRGQRHVFVMLD